MMTSQEAPKRPPETIVDDTNPARPHMKHPVEQTPNVTFYVGDDPASDMHTSQKR